MEHVLILKRILLYMFIAFPLYLSQSTHVCNPLREAIEYIETRYLDSVFQGNAFEKPLSIANIQKIRKEIQVLLKVL